MNSTVSTSATNRSTVNSRFARWKPAGALAVTRQAAERIAPLWPLRHFVAVNPFLGLSNLTFAQGMDLLGRVTPGGLRMDLEFYRDKVRSGEITDCDLDMALRRAASIPGPDRDLWRSLQPTHLRLALFQPADEERLPLESLTFAETLDQLHGTSWSNALTESVADFCAAYFDQGQSAWRMPWQGDSLFRAWKEAASIDLKLELLGIKRLRTRVSQLPEDPASAIATALNALRIDPAAAPDYLHRLLLSIRGWAGYAQYLAREANLRGAQDDSLLDLLAIRVSLDAALVSIATVPDLVEFWPPAPTPEDGISESTAIRYALQLALEHAWERRVCSMLASHSEAPSASIPVRPEVQAIFCIDVRSEVFRRALEAASPGIQTRGFAGFFGLPLDYRPLDLEKGQAQCPVLLTPKFTVHECLHEASRDSAKRRDLGIAKRMTHGWNAFKTSAISCFSFVETAGLLFGGSLVRDAFFGAPGKSIHQHDCSGPSLDYAGGIPAEARPALAFGMLKNMGLTRDFGRLVLLCGHGSETTNNPYASGLDCGACGGHAGDANARVGAALLNDPGVRASLAGDHGIVIPEDTRFLAGLHNTTTDDVVLYDTARLPASHAEDLATLRRHLATAGSSSRRERAHLLGLPSSAPDLDDAVRSRARDWSQVRPEWGLAGNAAFIAAPRSRTAGMNLGGRVFLHEYDASGDLDGSILELIMTAPMVVANWINLQYYASTVNNAVFGSGNKVLHNVVGTLGVCLGNGGDLQTGLPFQSVHDGTQFIHEPIRLHVFLEAPLERIEAVLEKHANVRELVNNGWLVLFALSDEDGVQRRAANGTWDRSESGPESSQFRRSRISS